MSGGPPQANEVLQRADWRVNRCIKTVEGVPRKTNAILAQEFGISASTIRRFKRMKGGDKKPIYRPQLTDPPASGSEAQSEEECDIDMTTTSSTADQTTFRNSLLDRGSDWRRIHRPKFSSCYFKPYEIAIAVAAQHWRYCRWRAEFNKVAA